MRERSPQARLVRLQSIIIGLLAAFILYNFLSTGAGVHRLDLVHALPAGGAINGDAPSPPIRWPFPAEVWAGGYEAEDPAVRQPLIDDLRARLGPANVTALAQLCGRVLYDSLAHSVTAHGLDDWSFVSTGDIKEQWTRDSAVQMAIYVPLLRSRPALRRVVEGALRSSAYFTVQDPYANSYSPRWRDPAMLEKWERKIGRGGWVGTRNYELDSGAYLLHFMYNYAASGVHAPEALLRDPLFYDVASTLVDVWTLEQHHEAKSSYRYSELPRGGKGALSAYTGMTWTGYRPSDDPTIYGYSIPSNVYAAGALERLLALNDAVWRDSDLETRARKLLRGIEFGIQTFGVVEVDPGVKVYAFEVDGLGNNVTNMDDANIPSLLSIPLLGWSGYDRDIYAATRRRLLQPTTNSYFFRGARLEGIGSPHTPDRMVWALAVVVRALTAGGPGGGGPAEAAAQLQMLLDMDCGSGTMHESVHVDEVMSCTRQVFQWANAAATTAIQALLGVDCDAEAETARLKAIRTRETREESGDGVPEDPLFYETLGALVTRDAISKAIQMGLDKGEKI